MHCFDGDIKELLPLSLEGKLDREGQARVARHLEACADCRLERSLLGAMAAEQVPDPGEEFWSRMPGQIHRLVRKTADERKRRGAFFFPLFRLSPRWVGTAAAVALVAAITWLLVRPLPQATVSFEQVEDVLPAGPIDIAALTDEEIVGADAWAERELHVLADEASAVMGNGKGTDISEELAGLDSASLERLSRMLDEFGKGGQV